MQIFCVAGLFAADQHKAEAAVTTIYLTSGSTWTVPSDWDSTSNTVEVLGGGGSGGVHDSGGGGGGEWRKVVNLALTPGASISYTIGAGGIGPTGSNLNGVAGGDTWFNGGSLAVSSVGAKGGGGGVISGSGGKGGGQTGNTGGVGTYSQLGGTGGNGAFNVGAGGGGAAGSTGDGTVGENGGAGGNGGSGDAGSGGAGGTNASPHGVAGTEWDATHGSGGGGDGADTCGATKGNGGAYGAGGGGTRCDSETAGSGSQGIIVIRYTPSSPLTTVYLTVGSSWTVPNDWNSASNTIEVIGGGGGGAYTASPTSGNAGGGGGAYSKIANQTLTPGVSVSYVVGAGGAAGTTGGDSYFCSSSANCGSIAGTAVVVGAKAGVGGSGTTGGAGGSSASGVGTTKNSGGAGGNSGNWSGAGGGGAAGASGAGKAGGTNGASGNQGAGGGGGANNGTAGTNGAINNGGAGGNGPNSSGAGAGGISGANGGAGSDGGGGGGGYGGSGSGNTRGGAGGAGTEWNLTHGSGGGGGGVGDSSSDSPKTPGSGGLYGGGGGGIADPGSVGALGAQGIIVIRYTPVSFSVNVSGTVYTDAGVTPAGGGATIYAKVGSLAVFSTTTRADGSFVLPILDYATSTTAVTLYVSGSSTLKATTFLTGLMASTSQSGIQLYKDTVISMSTSTLGTVDLEAGMKLYDSEDDADVLYQAPLTGTTTIYGNFIVATGTTKVPSALKIEGNFTNNGTFKNNGGVVDISGAVSAYGFGISPTAFTSVLSVGAQDTTPRGIEFSTDGLKMFVSGSTGDTVEEYVLTTAWDSSTASNTASLSIAAQATDSQGISFSLDGTQFFTTDYATGKIYRWTLSTPWSITSASFVASTSVSAQDLHLAGVAFNPSGNKMYVIGRDGVDVGEYTLSTPWDITTKTFTQAVSVAQDTIPLDLDFSPDGRRMFVVGYTSKNVNQYTLSTPWNVSTASYTKVFSVTSQDTAPVGLFFKPDGTKMYVVGDAGDEVDEYTLEAPFDLVPVYESNVSVTAQETEVRDVAFNPTGTKMYVIGQTGDDVNTYNLSTAFDVTTAVYSSVFSTAAQDASQQGISFNTDGTKMFIVGEGNDRVYEYTLSTGFDVSTASYSQLFSVSAQETIPQDIAFNTDGTKMFILGDSGNDVTIYNLSTGFDISTAAYDSVFSVSAQDTNPYGFAFNTDGTKMFMSGGIGKDINEYRLSTGFDLSTAVFYNNFSVNAADTVNEGIAFNTEGTKMYVIGNTADVVSEYSIPEKFEPGNAILSGSMTNTSGFNALVLSGGGTHTFAANASTSNFTITTASTTVPTSVVLPSKLTMAGNFANNGVLAAATTTTVYVSSTTAQTLAGNMTGTSAFNDIEFSGGGTKTFVSNAAAANVTIKSGATVVAPASLTIAGNYTNSGTFTNATGTITFTGTDSTVSGTLTGTSALNDVGVDGVHFKNNGVTWSVVSTLGNNDSWYAGAYGGGLFVAVSDYGDRVMVSSDNGTTWATTSVSGVEATTWRSIIYGKNMFVAVASSTGPYGVMTSPDGLHWTPRISTTPGANNWYGITYGNGLFVAVASTTGLYSVMTSPDGITWTARAASEANSWRAVTYGNGLFVAVSLSGTNRVMTSPDGITWTARAASEANSWRAVTYGNGLFVAVADTGTNRVMTSPDGITWTARAASEANSWRAVTYDNGLFVAVAESGTNRVMTSTDGFSWSPQSIAGNDDLWRAVTYGNNRFIALSYNGDRVAVSNSGTYTSGLATFAANASTSNLSISASSTVVAPSRLTIAGDYTNNGTFTNNSGTVYVTGDGSIFSGNMTGTSALNDVTIKLSDRLADNGQTWTGRSATEANTWKSVTYGNGIFVAVSSNGTNRVMSSPDGITWTARSAAQANAWRQVTYGNGMFVAVSEGGTSRVMSSPDGITWTARSAIGGTDGWTAVTYGGGLFVAASQSGPNRIMTSQDGITWTAKTAAQANTWKGVAYGNGIYVAVSQAGTNRVMTSPDGTTWTVQTAAAANSWESVTYGNGVFVAVSADGTNRVMTSTNGTAWTSRSAAAANAWREVTYGNGIFVAVSSDGTNHVMTSQDGITWTAQTASENNSLYGVVYGEGRFVVVSSDGTNQVLTASSSILAASAVTFANNASTTNFTIVDASSTVVAPASLSISGNYTNSGIFTSGVGTTTFNGASAQALAGSMTATNAFSHVVFTGSSTKTFSANASTSDFIIRSGVTVVAPSHLSIGGDYTNNGTFTAGTGTTTITKVPAPLGGYDFSSTTYSGRSFSVSAQDTSPQGLAFSADGRKMFIVGAIGQEVDEYTLSTPFNVTTASYATVLSVSAQDTSPKQIAFNPAGTKMFITGDTGDEVNEYTLGTAFSIATASFTQVLSLGTESASPRGIRFNADGTRMYVADKTSSELKTYALATPYSVSTASFFSRFSVDAQTVDPYALAFSADGASMYVLTDVGPLVYVYKLASPFVVSTASFAYSFSVGSQDTLPKSMTFNDLGTKMYMVGAANDTVYEYTMPAAFDFGMAYTDSFLSVGPQDTEAHGIKFNTDGTKMFVAGYTNDNVSEYKLATAYDISTAAFSQSFSTASEDVELYDVEFNTDGTKMFTVGGTGNEVNEYALSTGFDISTAAFTRVLSVNAQDTQPSGIAFNTDGTRMFIIGFTGASVYRYNLSTGFDISTAVYNSTLSVSAKDSSPRGIEFSPDGTSMFTTGITNNKIHRYTLSTPFDISTATFSSTFSPSAQDTAPRGVTFNTDGTKMFMTGVTNDRVYLYNLAEFSDSSTTFSGAMTASSSLNNVVILGTGTTTFASNASTSNFSNATSSYVVAPSRLTITGNYANEGVFAANSGTTTFTGTSAQSATGTMTGTSAFYNLDVENNSATTTFSTSVTASNNFMAVASATLAFPAAATTTFATFMLDGGVNGKIKIRSTASGTPSKLVVTTQKAVNFVDVQDSNACSGVSITATSSIDRGNNTCWNIYSQLSFSSAQNQTFTSGQATTSAATTTITESNHASITAVNDIRIAIATSTVHMLWDTTKTTATLGGTAAAKVSITVTYEGGGSVLVLNVTSDFAANDTLTVGGLSFAQFAAASAPSAGLELRTDGVSDQTANAIDTATVAISGSFVVANHDAGQVSNAFASSVNQSAQPLYSFKLTPSGESFTVTALVFNLSSVRRIDASKLTNITLYRDVDGNGAVGAGESAVGGAGTLAVSGETGTIRFTTPFVATTSQNYLVVADTVNIKPNEYMTMSLSVSGTVTGVTSLAAVTPQGSVLSVQHNRGAGAGGAGAEVGGAAPAGQGIVGGGGSGGVVSIGGEPGFQAPTANGSPFNEWTNGTNGYASDGVYATAASTNLRQSYSVFGFTVPGGNTVNGIQVKLVASGNTAAGTIQVGLSWNGDSTITSVQATPILTATDTLYTLGGPSDTWGRTWTPAELGDANFFVRVIAQPNSNTVKVDAIQVKPFHSAGGGGSGGGGSI